MKLQDQQRDLLRLIARSPQDADGWANVSVTLLPSVSKWTHPELAELVANDDGTGRIRLTETGKTLLEWL